MALRDWCRRAPLPERLTALAMAVVVIGVASWASVPVSSSRSPLDARQLTVAPEEGLTSTRGAAAAPSAAPTRSAQPAVAPSPGATAQSGPGTSLPPANPHTHRACPQGVTDQGITPTEIHLDVDVAALAGSAGNGLVGLPSASVEKEIFAAAIAGANKRGGAACRKLVAKYYTANPLDQSSLQALCLDMVADHPFALLDEGLSSPVGSPTPRDCPASHQLPTFGSLPLSQKELTQYSPYLFGYFATSEEIVRNWVLASKQLGWFEGYAKIGVIEQQCNPGLNTLAESLLARIGIPNAKIVTFDFGCPNAIPSPAVVGQAVVQFKRAGVTHVMDDGGVYENYFSKAAAQQGYHPKYSVGDQGTIALWNNAAFGPDRNNFNGGLAITETEYGAEHTVGIPTSQQTKQCDADMAAAGQPSAQSSPDGFSGVACSLVAMFIAAVEHAPQLKRSALAKGLAQITRLQLPYPAGPANFARSDGQVGGGFWRAATFRSSCACFVVTRRTFAPVLS